MIKQVVAVKDRLTGFTSVLLEENTAVAKRQFKAAFNQRLYVDKSDFELYKLGTFDTSNGKFEILDTPELLMTGNEVTPNVPDTV